MGILKFNTFSMNFSNYSSSIGKPYNFVQKLCGLETTESKTQLQNKEKMFLNNVELKITENHSHTNLQFFELFVSVIERIKNRISGRFALVFRIEELGNNINLILNINYCFFSFRTIKKF